MSQVLDFLYRLRRLEPKLRKPSATAPLPNCLVAMCVDGANPNLQSPDQKECATRSIAALMLHRNVIALSKQHEGAKLDSNKMPLFAL